MELRSVSLDARSTVYSICKKMNADHDFQIGKNHLVCQDYSLVWAGDTGAFAVLCDGCSASPDVDIGARIMALAAREVILTNHMDSLEYGDFGNLVLEKAGSLFSTFPRVHPQTLDSTLLVLQVNGNSMMMRAMIYGDGVFFHKSAAGLYAMKVELTSGAPDYLSYNLDPARKEQYETMSAADKEVKRLEIQDENGTGRFEYKPFAPVVISRPVQPGDIVAISSDGIGSFRRADNSSIPWLELAEDFIGYKNFTGVFVKRRMAAFKKKCLNEGWTHGDDISVASIVV